MEHPRIAVPDGSRPVAGMPDDRVKKRFRKSGDEVTDAKPAEYLQEFNHAVSPDPNAFAELL